MYFEMSELDYYSSSRKGESIDPTLHPLVSLSNSKGRELTGVEGLRESAKKETGLEQ